MESVPPPSAGRGDVYWSRQAGQLVEELGSAPGGLSSAEATARLRSGGPNAIGRKGGHPAVAAFLRQFRSPLVLILIFAAFVGQGSKRPFSSRTSCPAT